LEPYRFMKLVNKLELIYIPASYWNEPLSGFELISKAKQLPRNSSFFLLWNPTNPSEKELIERIKLSFPTIPANKLLTCKINFAVPVHSLKSDGTISSAKFFEVSSFVGKIMPIAPAVKLLFQLELIGSQDRAVKRYSNSIKTWAFLTKLIFELLNNGKFVPILDPITSERYTGQWRLLLKSQQDRDRFKTILSNSSWPAFCLPINFIKINGAVKSDGLWHPSYVFSIFMDDIGDYLIRSTINKSDFHTFKEFYSTEIAKETDPDFKMGWDYKFLKALIRKDPSFNVEEFYETVLPTLINNWTQSAQGLTLKQGFTFNLELKYPKNPEDDWPLLFYLSLQDGAKSIPLNELWEVSSLKKKEFQKFFETEGQFLEIILRALGAASKVFPPIKRALLETIKGEIKLTSREVMDFLRYLKDILIQSGFNIILPDVFRRGGKQRVSAKLIIRSKKEKKVTKGLQPGLPSLFDINSMLESKWEVSLEGKKISDEKFDNLINSDDPLINLGGKWILVDQQNIEDLKGIKESETKSYMDALKLGLTGKIQLQLERFNYKKTVFNTM